MNWIQGLLIASIFALVVFLLRSRRACHLRLSTLRLLASLFSLSSSSGALPRRC